MVKNTYMHPTKGKIDMFARLRHREWCYGGVETVKMEQRGVFIDLYDGGERSW